MPSSPPKYSSNTGEVYSTSNFLIKYITNRFSHKIECLLDNFHANKLVGLDIGTAEGHLLLKFILKKKIHQIFCVEFEFEKIKTSTSVLHHHYPQFLQCDAQFLCCKTNSFDFVLATEVLEHLPQPSLALKEISRVAKPKAPVVISVPYEPYFHLGNILRGKHWKRGGKTPSHLHFWHKKEFSVLLREYLIIKRCYSIATFPWLIYYCENKLNE